MTRKCERPDRERGAVGIIFLLLLPLVLTFVAFVTDVGYAFYSKRALQDALDLAAVAAARELPSEEAAESAAINSLEDNGYTAGDLAEPVFGTYVARTIGVGGGLIYPVGDRFVAGGATPNAVRLTGQTTAPSFFARIVGIDMFDIGARATAIKEGPLTSLTIASTLVTVDTTKSALLNAVFGSLLGGSVNLSAVGYQGLLNSQIDLVQYLDLLAINAGLSAGSYQDVLSTNVSAGILVQTAADLLSQGSPSSIDLDAVAGLTGIHAVIPPGLTLPVGDVLQIAEGTPDSALEVGLFKSSTFDVLNAVVQAANNENALSTAVGLTIPGVVNVTVKAGIVERPQTSAVGGVGIFVRTAQTRLLVSADLPLASIITPIKNGIIGILSAVLSLTGSQLAVDIIDGRLNIYLELANSNATVTAIGCDVQQKSQRSVDVNAQVGIAHVYLGKFTPAQETEVFSSNLAVPTPGALNLLHIKSLVSVIGLVTINLDIGVQLQADLGVGGVTNQPLHYVSDFATPQVKTVGAVKPLSDLTSGLANPSPVVFSPAPVLVLKVLGIPVANLSSLLGSITTLVNGLVNGIVTPVVSSVLDTVLATLLPALGVQLGSADVTVNFLTCPGARLVSANLK